MKKFILICLLVIPLSTFAQRFSGGVLFGFNASQIHGDRWGGYNKAGLVGGAFVTTELQDKWGGQLEIRYAAKGSAPSIDNPLKRKIRLQYIELPILGTYDFNNQFQFQVGISLGYLYSAMQNDGYGYEDFERYDPYEVAICMGVRYLLSDRLTLNARLSYSILPIYASYSGSTDIFTSYNNAVTFAGYYQIGR